MFQKRVVFCKWHGWGGPAQEVSPWSSPNGLNDFMAEFDVSKFQSCWWGVVTKTHKSLKSGRNMLEDDRRDGTSGKMEETHNSIEKWFTVLECFCSPNKRMSLYISHYCFFSCFCCGKNLSFAHVIPKTTWKPCSWPLRKGDTTGPLAPRCWLGCWEFPFGSWDKVVTYLGMFFFVYEIVSSFRKIMLTSCM